MTCRSDDMLIQSQHVILTGMDSAVGWLLNVLKLKAARVDVTITVVQPSTPAVYPGMQDESRKSPAEKEQ